MSQSGKKRSKNNGSEGMPVPASSEAPTQADGMAPRAVDGANAAASDGMPRPTTGTASPSGDTGSGMPVPAAATAPGGTPPRFGPPGGIAPDGPRLEPGVVEVQFRDGVAPTLSRSTPDAAPTITGSAVADLGGVNDILRRHGLRSAEPTLQVSHDEARQAQAVAASQGIDAPSLSHFVTLHFTEDADTSQIADELRALPDVETAIAVPAAAPPTAGTLSTLEVGAVAPPATPLTEPLVGTGDVVVLDPVTGLENQWYLFRCHVDRAWGRSSGAGVVIADIDWGFRTSHQDLSGRFGRVYNAFDGGSDVTHGGSVFHGTGVTGFLGAAVNGRGIAGIAYGATLWGVQADSGPGTGLGGNAWARAIDWVRTTSSGISRKVVNLEVQTGNFGNYEQVPSVAAAIKTAIGAGVVVCVAAGNGDKDASLDDSGNPIPETGSILVGATAYDSSINKRAWFSNYGSRIVVAAPGDPSHDLTCDATSDTAYRNGFGGTSGATPKVAGVAALMLAVNPSLTHADVRRILNATGAALTPDPGKALGTFLDADAAVRQAAVGAVGRVEVFARGSDKALWHTWQTTPGGAWSGWRSEGGWIDLLDATRNADGRLEVFARGSDKALWHTWQTTPGGAWSGWTSVGGWIDLLAPGVNEDGRLEVFARGSDQALWHTWQTAPGGAWSGWRSEGGWIDLLDVARNADGRLEVFARGSDKALWHNWQTTPNGGWSGWYSLGGWIDLLASGVNEDGRLEVFVRGSDKAVWHNWQTTPGGAWSGWYSLGGWIDLLDVARNADGRLEVFARGSDAALWHIWQTTPGGAWSGWRTEGGWIDRLSCTQNQDGRIEAFARGSDDALWHTWQTTPNGGWSGWRSLGGWIDLLKAAQNGL